MSAVPADVTASLRTVRDPRSGQVVESPVASCVEISFTSTLASRWRIEEAPGHLVPLSQTDDGFVFMVFSPRSEPRPLRLVRFRVDREGDLEERVVHILPSDRVGARRPVPQLAVVG